MYWCVYVCLIERRVHTYRHPNRTYCVFIWKKIIQTVLCDDQPVDCSIDLHHPLAIAVWSGAAHAAFINTTALAIYYTVYCRFVCELAATAPHQWTTPASNSRTSIALSYFFFCHEIVCETDTITHSCAMSLWVILYVLYILYVFICMCCAYIIIYIKWTPQKRTNNRKNIKW